MKKDPIIEEIHKARGEIHKTFKGDIKKYLEYLKEREQKEENPQRVVQPDILHKQLT